ncbi:hypothetical protein F5X96DRAFT_652451 [Biscogniauxia mediterranea]|nr:hypothetical protein F5X96DRAFT_652451 [Biscogniauxia mediterranea]
MEPCRYSVLCLYVVPTNGFFFFRTPRSSHHLMEMGFISVETIRNQPPKRGGRQKKICFRARKEKEREKKGIHSSHVSDISHYTLDFFFLCVCVCVCVVVGSY